MSVIEYTCHDCGKRIISYRFPESGEISLGVCATCDWIRAHVPARDQPAARERLGVPLTCVTISGQGGLP
jgi:hypothetical protein